MAIRRLDNEFVNVLVNNDTEYDEFIACHLSQMLDRASGHVRRFLRGTDQWQEDVDHEKFALRWGYELLERFLLSARAELPCRPMLLLDSLVAKFFSQPDPLLYEKDLTTPLGRFVDGFMSRSVVSRDALMVLFYHLFGYTQSQVERFLALPNSGSHRVYKNFERWRQSGWQSVLDQVGLTEFEITQIEDAKERSGAAYNREAERLIRIVQKHYRKSEPEHYACPSSQEWTNLFTEDTQYDYRCWHLPLCLDCTEHVYGLRQEELRGMPPPRIDFQFRPIARGTFPHARIARLNEGERYGVQRRA